MPARAADGAVGADRGAAGNAGAAGHGRVLADAHVVADLDQVVELDAVLDHGVLQRAAVDAGVGADLDVVADAHRAQLLDLFPGARAVGREAEAVGADHHARMHDAALADHAVLAHAHARLQHRAGADARAALDHAQRRRCGQSGSTTASGSITALGWIAGPAAGARCFFHSWVSAGEVQVGLVGDDAVAARQRRLAHGRRHDDAAGPGGGQLLLGTWGC